MASARIPDISRRAGLVIQVLGLALLAVLYPLESPFYTAGIMLFETGVLVSAVSLPVRAVMIKTVILISALTGLTLQGTGYFFAPEEYAGSIMIAGIGLVCGSACGIIGREAYCFGYREGWVLATAVFPFMVLVNLLLKENLIVNSLGFAGLFLLLLSLTGRKLQQTVLPGAGNETLPHDRTKTGAGTS